MCLKPLILIGWLLTQNFGGHNFNTNLDAAAVEVQTCESGPGLDVKAATSGLYGVAVQYGFTTTRNGWTFTATPKLGVAYVDHQAKEQAHPANFELGGQLLFGRDRWRIGAEYWHISNAHTSVPNLGIDLLILQTGWIF